MLEKYFFVKSQDFIYLHVYCYIRASSYILHVKVCYFKKNDLCTVTVDITGKMNKVIYIEYNRKLQ